MTAKSEAIHVRLPPGTTDRIKQVLRGGEIPPAFIRFAIEEELTKRENTITRKKTDAAALARVASAISRDPPD